MQNCITKAVDIGNFSEQPREAAVLTAHHNHKRHAGGDPHVASNTRQTGRQRFHRADTAGPRVDPRLASAERYGP